jgi:hypothetical protein
MVFDSLNAFAALALFAACAGAWLLAAPLRAPARLYLRFAAMLFAALSVAAVLELADSAALFLLPLAGASLMVSAFAQWARPLPVFAASLALVLALAGGLAALLSGVAVLALAPLMIAGLAVMAAALNGAAVFAVLAGVSLLVAGLAFLEQGSRAGVLLLCAAALIGLAQRRSALMVEQRRPARRGAAIGGLSR